MADREGSGEGDAGSGCRIEGARHGRGGLIVSRFPRPAPGEPHLSPHHRSRDLHGRRVARRHAGDRFAVPHDGDAIGDVDHFVELVRDEDDRAAPLTESAQDAPELLHLRRREHRRGLVENEETRAAEQRLEDLHPLRFTDGEIAHEAVHVHVEAELSREPLHLHRRERHVDGNAARRLAPENDVFGDRERRHEHEVLVHHPHAGGDGVRGRPPGDVPPAHLHRPLVRRVEPRENAHERRLPCAVLPDERVDLSRRHLERRPAVRPHGAERLVDVAHGHRGRRKAGSGKRRASRGRTAAGARGLASRFPLPSLVVSHRSLGTWIRPAMISASISLSRACTLSGISGLLRASST